MKKILILILSGWAFSCCYTMKSSKIKTTDFKNLHKLNDTIYRSEQPKLNSLKEIKNLEIYSILNLRNDISDTLVFKNDPKLYLYQVKMTAWNPNLEELKKALLFIKNSKKPILIHCKHGADRTGLVIASYRIIFENWSKKDAIKEMRFGHYGFHDKYYVIPKFIRQTNFDQLKKELNI